MFRKLVKSTYFKAGEVLTCSGILIVIISNWLGKTNMKDMFANIHHVLTPVYIGIVLAFLLCPLYNLLVRELYRHQKTEDGFLFDNMGPRGFGTRGPNVEKKVSSERRALKIAKSAASTICMVMVVGVVALLGYVLLPELIDSIAGFVNTLPEKTDAFVAWADENLTALPSVVAVIHRVANAGTEEAIQWIQVHLLRTDFVGLAELISTSVISVVKIIINIIIGLLIAIYLLNYKEMLLAISRKLLAATCSDNKAKSITEFGHVINDTFIGFIVGRLLDAAIIWGLTYCVMAAFKMPDALLISSIVGITNVIPFFGPFIGAIPSFIILLLEEPMQGLYFLIMIVIIQQIDGNVIGPRVVGNAIGLSSFWVLMAVLIGGGLFGFLGMVLGVPVFAVIYRYVNKFTSGRLRRKDKNALTTDYLDLEKYNIDAKDIIK